MRQNRVLLSIINVLSSNIGGLCLGLVITLYLPFKLSIEDYGYFQIYLMYSSYLGIFVFGLLDGMNLKYAGQEYKNLDYELFRKYFVFTLILSTFFCFIVIGISFFINLTNEVRLLIIAIGLNIITFNINGYFTHLNQLSLRFKQYSMGIILERILFILCFIPLMFFKDINFIPYVFINIICRMGVIIYNIYNTREILSNINWDINSFRTEYKNSIKVGLPVMLSGFISMVIIAIPRILVQTFMGVEEFAMISFAMSILSMVIQIIIALATVLYPILRQIDKCYYEDAIKSFSNIVTFICVLGFVGYYFVNLIIQKYIPKYIDVLDYLYLFFPFMFYQCKNNICVMVFYKVLRLEKDLIKNYILGLLICSITTFLAIFVTGNINIMIMTFVIMFALWVYMSLNKLIKTLNWSIHNQYFKEIALVCFFIIINNIFTNEKLMISFGCFLVATFFYFFSCKSTYIKDISFIRYFLKI